MTPGAKEGWAGCSLLVKKKTGCGCHWCEEPFTDNDHLPMKAIIADASLRDERAFHKVAWDSPQELRDVLSLVGLTLSARHVPYGYALSF